MEYTNGVVKQFVIIVEVSYSNKSTNKKGAAKKVGSFLQTWSPLHGFVH